MTVELAQLELLAHVDDLVARLGAWSNEPSAWEAVQQSQSLVRRLLARLEPLRARVEAPLVVATFGGTGVGKSSLVNGRVGQEVTTAGRQRPTTTQPIVLAHPQTDLAAYHLPLEQGEDELRVVRVDTPLLRDIVIIDCPDPDTSETETSVQQSCGDCIGCCRTVTCCCYMSGPSRNIVRPKSVRNCCRRPVAVDWSSFNRMRTWIRTSARIGERI